jgi:hypothetical protein
VIQCADVKVVIGVDQGVRRGWIGWMKVDTQRVPVRY